MLFVNELDHKITTKKNILLERYLEIGDNRILSTPIVFNTEIKECLTMSNVFTRNY